MMPELMLPLERRALLLGRVSRLERTQDPATQLEALRRAAAAHRVTVAGELAHGGGAWDDDDAAALRVRVLEELERTKATELWCWALDRLCRGGIEAAFRWLRELSHRGVAFYSLQEPFLSTSDRATRDLLLSFIAWAAEQESRRRSDRLKAKAAYKRQAAEKLGERARWGRGRLPAPADVEGWKLELERGASLRAIASSSGFGLATVHRHLGPYLTDRRRPR